MLKKDRDLKIEYCLAAGILLVLFRLWPASRQMIFILPLSAPIDDEPYFNRSNSIAAVTRPWITAGQILVNIYFLFQYGIFAYCKMPYFLLYNCRTWRWQRPEFMLWLRC